MQKPNVIQRVLGGVSLLAVSGCRPIDRCCDPESFVDGSASLNPANTAGVLLSFDDSHVDEWYAFGELLEQYDAVATFFVTRFDYLDDEQVEKLRELEARGNEIGCHSHRHLPSGQYSRRYSVDAWISDDIEPSIEAFESKGFFPTSFAFPFGEHTPETAEAALEHFSHIRGSFYVGKIRRVSWSDPVLIPAEELPQRRFSCAFAIDKKYGVTEKDLQRGIDRALERGEVLAIYGHNPVPVPVEPLDTSYALLEYALKTARENGMRFYTYNDFSTRE